MSSPPVAPNFGSPLEVCAEGRDPRQGAACMGMLADLYGLTTSYQGDVNAANPKGATGQKRFRDFRRRPIRRSNSACRESRGEYGSHARRNLGGRRRPLVVLKLRARFRTARALLSNLSPQCVCALLSCRPQGRMRSHSKYATYLVAILQMTDS